MANNEWKKIFVLENKQVVATCRGTLSCKKLYGRSISIMQLQAFEEDDPNLKEKLLANVACIGTRVSIHENLYESERFATLQFSENLETIVHKLIKTMQSQTKISVDSYA